MEKRKTLAYSPNVGRNTLGQKVRTLKESEEQEPGTACSAATVFAGDKTGLKNDL